MNMGTNKNKKILNINNIYKNLDEHYCKTLTFCHIFTGNDYNPLFFKKGKKRPLSILRKSNQFQKAFINLASTSPSGIKIGSAEL